MKQEQKVLGVMKKVAKIEERRLLAWTLWLVPSLIVMVFILLYYGTRVWSSLSGLGVFELISSLTDDFESAKAMVIENVTIIWEIIPRRSLYISLFTLAIVLSIIIFNRKRLMSFPRRISSIFKYIKEKGGEK